MRETGDSKFKQHFIFTLQLKVIMSISTENSLYQIIFIQQFTLHLRNSNYLNIGNLLFDGRRGEEDCGRRIGIKYQ